MKNKKIIITISVILFIVLISLIFINKKQEYSKNIYYMDTYIYVKVYSNNKNEANKILTEVENIYKEYHELSDRYNHYDGIINIYDIKNNTSGDKYLMLDNKLYELLEYSKNWSNNYNKVNIEIGNIIDVWKKYRDRGEGIPSLEELESNKNYVELILLGDNKILNNHPNLDLGSITKGYATEVVGKYLESIGVNDYLINAGGNVKVGNAYEKDVYKIGVQSPIEGEDLLTIVKGENISVVTSGGYERNYEYDGKVYHHIIDPDTLYPSDYTKSVTVITSNSALGDILSTTLFLMSIEEGKELVKQIEAEAIWYTNDNEIIKSEGFNNYE